MNLARYCLIVAKGSQIYWEKFFSNEAVVWFPCKIIQLSLFAALEISEERAITKFVNKRKQERIREINYFAF